MASEETCSWTMHRLHREMAAGRLSSEEAVRAVLDRVAVVEPRLRSFLRLREAEDLLSEARAVDQARARGETLGPLAGVPVAVKDNLSTRGLQTTCGSRMLAHYTPPFDATVVQRLRQERAIILGKTNMDEFAMGSSTEHSAFGPTRNPWDPGRVPGGSSGGSAAAVAADEAFAALGSDTGGSIRQPAAFCGVVGVKPTYGRVSRYGLVAFASSLDQVGPLTKDVRDAALMLQAIAGPDERDATCSPEPLPDLLRELEEGCRGERLGVPRELLGEGVAAEVRSAVAAAIDVFVELGAEVEECSLPTAPYALDAYYVIAPAEASSNLARYDGVRFGHRAASASSFRELFAATRAEGFGPEVRRRILLGTYALSAGYYEEYYGRAQRVRTLICREFDEAFRRYRALLSPTAPTAAFRLGERLADPLAMYVSDICTVPVNLAGLPAISVPCGFADGLPLGLQIIGRPMDEAGILRLARAYEQATAAERRRPPLPFVHTVGD